MGKDLSWFTQKIIGWLVKEPQYVGTPLCNIDRMRFELRPGDVVLVEGRSRISEVIKLITQSSWTHACLYIGRIYDIEDPDLRHEVMSFYRGDPNEQLIIEAMLGQGTIVEPITKYKKDHLRICRPKGYPHRTARKSLPIALNN